MLKILNRNKPLSSKTNQAFSFLDSSTCPVWAFQFYMAKLNKNRNDLWQKPKTNVHGSEDEWFVNQVLGKDTLNNAMKNLSVAANLSIYPSNSGECYG